MTIAELQAEMDSVVKKFSEFCEKPDSTNPEQVRGILQITASKLENSYYESTFYCEHCKRFGWNSDDVSYCSKCESGICTCCADSGKACK